MSGLALIFWRNGASVDPPDVHKMVQALRIHGPEGSFACCMDEVAFGYTHFANTPEASLPRKPTPGGGGRYHMVFDGRLDNRSDLANALFLSAAELGQMSDVALAMRCWEKWQHSAFNKWVGEFAVLIWDADERKVIAVRDHFGGRLMYYHETADRIVFATAPKGIHTLRDIPRQVDTQKVAQALCQIYTDPERSFFQGIKRVPPACYKQVTPSSSGLSKYYDVRDHIRPIQKKSDDAYVEEAREVFDTALTASLRTKGGTGVLMSGGMDSSTVAVSAARDLAEKGQDLQAYTWVPEQGWDGRTPRGWYGDETVHAKRIAEMTPNLDLHLVDAAGRGHSHKQDAFLNAAEAPQRNALLLPYVHAALEKAQHQGVRTVLNGHMGDLTLSYMGQGIFAYLWRAGKYRALFQELQALSPGRINSARAFFTHVVFPTAPDWLWKTKERLRGRSGAGSRQHWKRTAAIHPAFAERTDIKNQVGRGPGGIWEDEPPTSDPRGDDLDTLQEIANETAEFSQGFSALYGVEFRDPFADRRVVEWSLGVPEDQFWRSGQPRWLLARMMQGKLPEQVLNKPRKTYRGMQVSDWHLRLTRDQAEIKSELALFETDPDVRDMIDLRRLQEVVDNWPEETVVNEMDDRRFYLPVVLPMALQIGHFVRKVSGRN